MSKMMYKNKYKCTKYIFNSENQYKNITKHLKQLSYEKINTAKNER